jgi:GGDEF domain-containing protein
MRAEMPDDHQPAKPAPKRRSRRFVALESDDHQVSEKIEKFLSGPRVRNRTRHPRPAAPGRGGDSVLDTRTDFTAALNREAARSERYGRPATVIAVEFELAAPVATMTDHQLGREIDRLAGPIAFTLRREARDTDRIARIAPNRFHVLLPETGEGDARSYVDRARQACEIWFTGAALSVNLRIEAASTGRGRSLTDALAAVEGSISA